MKRVGGIIAILLIAVMVCSCGATSSSENQPKSVREAIDEQVLVKGVVSGIGMIYVDSCSVQEDHSTPFGEWVATGSVHYIDSGKTWATTYVANGNFDEETGDAHCQDFSFGTFKAQK